MIIARAGRIDTNHALPGGPVAITSCMWGKHCAPGRRLMDLPSYFELRNIQCAADPCSTRDITLCKISSRFPRPTLINHCGGLVAGKYPSILRTFSRSGKEQ